MELKKRRMSEERKRLDIYCDGGARGNPGPAAIGFAVKTGSGRLLHQHAQTLGVATNNTAEYEAVIVALRWLKRLNAEEKQPTEIRFFLDSRLVVNQLIGNFKVKEERLKKAIVEIRKLEREIGATTGKPFDGISQKGRSIRYFLIPREQNSLADALVNQALDRQ